MSAQSYRWGAAVGSNFAHLFAQGFISSFIIQPSEIEYLPCQLNWGRGAAAPCALRGLAAETAEPSPVLGEGRASCAIWGDRDTWANSGSPWARGRVTGLVHATNLTFFFFNNVYSCFLLLFWEWILTLVQGRSTSNRKLNLHFTFNFASGLCKWTAKLISEQKFLLNQRPSGNCGRTVFCCAQDWYSEKKPKQQSLTFKKPLCSNWKGYFGVTFWF